MTTLYAQGELFPTQVAIHPTPSMLDDAGQFITMCAGCGLLVCAVKRIKLAACPACGGETWWGQHGYAGPFRPADDPHVGCRSDLDCPVPVHPLTNPWRPA